MEILKKLKIKELWVWDVPRAERLWTWTLVILQSSPGQTSTGLLRRSEGDVLRVWSKKVTGVARGIQQERIARLLCETLHSNFPNAARLCSPSSLCFSRRSETCYPAFGWLLDTFRKAYLDNVLVWSASWDRKTKFLPVLTKYVHANKTQNELLTSSGPCKSLDGCDLTAPSLSLPPTYTQAIHPQTR